MERKTQILHNLSPKSDGRGTLSTDFEASMIFKLKLDKDNTQKKTYKPISLVKIDFKILNKILAISKRITHHGPSGTYCRNVRLV